MSKLRKTVVDFIDQVGEASGCHRMPERSFFFKGHQFPVCARCTGVAIGQTLAVIVGLCKKVISIPVSLLLLLIMGFDWGIQEAGWKESNNTRRFITGICGGFGLFSIYINVIFKLIKRIKTSHEKTPKTW